MPSMPLPEIDTISHEIDFPDSDCAAFVMPFYGDQELSVQYLTEAVEGFDNQSDPRWRAIIVDDATPPGEAADFLTKLGRDRPDHIHVIRLAKNMRHGHARNVGVSYAAERGYPFVLYNDADDISHPDRVKSVRAAFDANPLVDLVYSGFMIIDENKMAMPESETGVHLLALSNLLRTRPIIGQDAWIRMGLESVASIPSSTALRTSAALACPSPRETPAEDYYQALHVSAAGGAFAYLPDVPSWYRVTSSVQGSSHHRKRVGVQQFNTNLAAVRTAGFLNALRVARGRGHWSSHVPEILLNGFYLRLAENMMKVGQTELADEIFREHLTGAFPSLSARLVADR